MTEKHYLIIKDERAVNVNGNFLMTAIQHQLNGLPKGIIVKDEFGQRWQLGNRMLFTSTVDIHTIFENEEVEIMKLTLSTIQKQRDFKNRIQQEEEQKIYYYSFRLLDEYKGKIPNLESILEIIENA